MKVLNITTTDGGNFRVELDVARQSVTIWTMLEALNIDEDSNKEDLVPLINNEVTKDAFAKSLVWMEYNRGKPDFQKDSNGDESKPK